MLDLNEFQTRKLKIDVLLQEQGWDVSNRSKVVLEVDTKQSDFKKQDYRQVNETDETMLKASMQIICCWTAQESRWRLLKQNARPEAFRTEAG